MIFWFHTGHKQWMEVLSHFRPIKLLHTSFFATVIITTTGRGCCLTTKKLNFDLQYRVIFLMRTGFAIYKNVQAKPVVFMSTWINASQIIIARLDVVRANSKLKKLRVAPKNRLHKTLTSDINLMERFQRCSCLECFALISGTAQFTSLCGSAPDIIRHRVRFRKYQQWKPFLLRNMCETQRIKHMDMDIMCAHTLPEALTVVTKGKYEWK